VCTATVVAGADGWPAFNWEFTQPWVPHPCVLRKGGYHKCINLEPLKSNSETGFSLSRKIEECSRVKSNPTLSAASYPPLQKSQGRATLFVDSVGEIKTLGHPPTGAPKLESTLQVSPDRWRPPSDCLRTAHIGRTDAVQAHRTHPRSGSTLHFEAEGFWFFVPGGRSIGHNTASGVQH
jgi:hypothetical protein